MASFWDRIRSLFRRVKPAPRSAPTPAKPAPPKPTDEIIQYDSAIDAIQAAGKAHRLLQVIYDGKTRIVEPYSFRYRPSGEHLFYGFCSIHQKIHSFKVEKIQQVRILDGTFTPRWPVEF